jgi:hypothetical protein
MNKKYRMGDGQRKAARPKFEIKGTAGDKPAELRTESKKQSGRRLKSNGRSAIRCNDHFYLRKSKQFRPAGRESFILCRDRHVARINLS